MGNQQTIKLSPIGLSWASTPQSETFVVRWRPPKQLGRSRKTLRDNSPIPRYPLGGASQTFTPAYNAPPVDWTNVGGKLPSDPQLIARRLELGLVPDNLVDLAKRILEVQGPPKKERAGSKKQAAARKSKPRRASHKH